MDLYLVRHAVAEDRNPARWPDDSRRPLTPEGEERFRKACRGLRRLAPDPALVISSGAVRAWRTALILQEEAGWPAPVCSEELGAPYSPGALLRALQAQRAETVAVVGHEPHLSTFATYLLTGDEAPTLIEMKKGGAACLSFPGPAEAGHATLRWLATPKLLRAAAG